MSAKQLECRIVIRRGDKEFRLGMFDPLNLRYEPLGTHPNEKIDKVVGDLKASIERAGHRLTFSEQRDI